MISPGKNCKICIAMEEQTGKLIEPPPVAFSFSAPGWYVLGGLVLLAVLLVLLLAIRYYRSNRYRRDALRYLSEKQKELSSQNAFGMLVYESNMLVKRIAMSRYGRAKVAGLQAEQWIAFINTTWGERSFNDQEGQLLTRDIYSQTVHPEQAVAFTSKAMRWIKKHKKHL
jgi:hypothetical protein